MMMMILFRIAGLVVFPIPSIHWGLLIWNKQQSTLATMNKFIMALFFVTGLDDSMNG